PCFHRPGCGMEDLGMRALETCGPEAVAPSRHTRDPEGSVRLTLGAEAHGLPRRRSWLAGNQTPQPHRRGPLVDPQSRIHPTGHLTTDGQFAVETGGVLAEDDRHVAGLFEERNPGPVT